MDNLWQLWGLTLVITSLIVGTAIIVIEFYMGSERDDR